VDGVLVGWVLVHSGQQQNGHVLPSFLQTKNIFFDLFIYLFI
jgi:hypothetical protein